MTNQEAALKSLDNSMQVSDEGLLFVGGKPYAKFQSDGSTHQAQRQQNQGDSKR